MAVLEVRIPSVISMIGYREGELTCFGWNFITGDLTGHKTPLIFMMASITIGHCENCFEGEKVDCQLTDFDSLRFRSSVLNGQTKINIMFVFNLAQVNVHKIFILIGILGLLYLPVSAAMWWQLILNWVILWRLLVLVCMMYGSRWNFVFIEE